MIKNRSISISVIEVKLSYILVSVQRSPCSFEAYGGGWEGLGKEGHGCAVHLKIYLYLMTRKWKCLSKLHSNRRDGLINV